MRKYCVFQDESGEPGKPFFFSSALVIPQQELASFYDVIGQVRDIFHFYDELHFEKMSSLRVNVYRKVLRECLTEIQGMHSKTIVIENRLVDMDYFKHNHHLAYNFFTRQVIQNSIRGLDGEILIYPDQRSRLHRDNFLEYIKRELNWQAFRNGWGYDVTLVEPRDSKLEQGLQVADLLQGVIRQKYSPAESPRKVNLAREVMCWPCFKRKTNDWKWRPNP